MGDVVGDDFAAVLGFLRAISAPCVPPVGVGTFDVLFVNGREIVVWYSPARDGQHEGERAIPTARLAAAWQALVGGTTLDEAALEELGGNRARGRWLLALLALLPGVNVHGEPLALALRPAMARRCDEPHPPDPPH